MGSPQVRPAWVVFDQLVRLHAGGERINEQAGGTGGFVLA
jgi:hypothetical protein